MAGPLLPTWLSGWSKTPERLQLVGVLLVALVCGAVASLGTLKFLRDRERALTRSAPVTVIETATVIVAKQDLDPGAVLDLGVVEPAQWPHEYVPDSSFSDAQRLAGREVKTRIFRGEPIVEARLIASGERGGLQGRIPVGLLAISMKVDAEIGVSGFVQPGDRVDVVATMRNKTEPMTRIVLQNVLVLAIEHDLEPPADGKPKEVPTVTLAVKPEEAERLASARSDGQMILALRNLRDDTIYDTPGFSAADLAETVHHVHAEAEAEAESPPEVVEEPPLPQPVYHVVQLIEGEDASEVKFELR